LPARNPRKGLEASPASIQQEIVPRGTSARGQTRHIERASAISAVAPKTDILLPRNIFRDGPKRETLTQRGLVIVACVNPHRLGLSGTHKS
jgi:hypothetical protein